MSFSLFVFIVFASLLSGCRTYSSKPIDWKQEAVTWSASTNRLLLTQTTARQTALFFNPELNALRLRHLASSNLIRQTGWWQDPELSLDARRIIKGVSSSWIIDAPLTLTIPVNGVPGLERKAATAYAYAAACAISVQERALATEVDHLWQQLVATKARLHIQQTLAHKLVALTTTAQALLVAGELPATEATQVQLEQLRLHAEIAQLRTDQETHRLALLRLLGFHPETPLDLDLTPEWPVLRTIQETDLVRHPRVQEKLARLAAAEADLRTEIRRQIPDLTLGPAGGYEEGEARAGLAFGMTLPLWNHNRLSIAKSDAEREQIRLEACQEWRNLVSELHLAQRAYVLAEKQVKQLQQEELPRAEENLIRMERLYQAGEVNLFQYLVVFQTHATTQRNAVTAQQTLRDAQITLTTFTE